MMNTTIITKIMAALGQDELKELIGALQGMVDAPETVQKHWEPTEGEQYFYLWGTRKERRWSIHSREPERCNETCSR